MSESNIYKEHYDLQQAHTNLAQSLQNVYAILYPLVAPQGVQLTLQEVLELTVERLSRETSETVEPTQQQVNDIPEDKPVRKASKKSSE